MQLSTTLLNQFRPVALENISAVKLMSRIDQKYWFHAALLNDALQAALPYYNVLEINGHRLMDYQTTYFDTPTDSMYLKHHNRKRNRHKIRQRRYASTDTDFLEIKFKTNKKRTLKRRISTDFSSVQFSHNELDFIRKESPFQGQFLLPRLHNEFKRITLIHKEMSDRCTIDMAPVFRNEHGQIRLEELVIFELKKGRNLNMSPFIAILRQLKIRQSGMSKYCTGRALLDAKLKQNAFKPRLRFLTKNF